MYYISWLKTRTTYSKSHQTIYCDFSKCIHEVLNKIGKFITVLKKENNLKIWKFVYNNKASKAIYSKFELSKNDLF